jgi:hypothetical protein
MGSLIGNGLKAAMSGDPNAIKKFADQNKGAIQKTVSSIDPEAGKALEEANSGSSMSSLTSSSGLGDSESSQDNSLVSSESASSGPSVGSDAETGVANNIMCKGFQELFTKNQAKYNEFLFRSLEKYFNEGHTKLLLDKMLNKNMGEYIKSNQFRGIIQSEIKHSIGSIMQSTLKLELRNKNNYSGMCNEIGKLNNKRRGGGTMKTRTKTRTRDPSKKRRTFKRRN